MSLIPQPMRFVHGQALRPETLNQVLDTLRRITPIAGPGILLHHSPNGTTFSVKYTSAPLPPAFNHPFKVTLTKKADGGSSAKVLQGRFFTLAEGIATQVHFALEKLEATDGGWTADTCSYGDALYIKKTDEGYTLEWGTDIANALYIIASIEGDRYATPPRLEVKQHLLSDLYLVKELSENVKPPVAWEVRQTEREVEVKDEEGNTVTDDDGNPKKEMQPCFEVYHPVWICGRTTYQPASMTQGTWNLLDKSLESGTLYAVLQEKAKQLESDDATPTWVFEKVYLTNKTAEIPAEAQPDLYNDGHRCTVVAIGKFSGSGESVKWTQWHVGAIVERTPGAGGGGAGLADGLSLLGPIRIFKESDGAVWLKQGHLKWSAASAAFVENFDNPISILRLDEALQTVLVESYIPSDPYDPSGQIELQRCHLEWGEMEAGGSTAVAPSVPTGFTPYDTILLTFKAEKMAFVDSSGQMLKSKKMFVLADGDASTFATVTTVDFTQRLSVTEPSDETVQGALTAHPASVTVLSTRAVTPGQPETLFKTEVEEANEASTYEAAGGSNG